MKKFEQHITASQGITAIELLAEHCDLSRAQLKAVMQKGAVWLSHDLSPNNATRIRRAKRRLNKNDTLHIYYDEKVLNSPVASPQLIANCNVYSVWNKPSGMLSQGSKWGDHSTITRWAEQHMDPQRNAFLVHRLDRAASGLILIAHSKKIAATLSKMFADRAIRKTYHALVHGHWSLASPLTIEQAIDDKVAISHVNLLNISAADNTSLLEVEIKTGRKHQIRKHLAAQGYPIVGDRLYGDKNQQRDLMLTSVSLSFICPVENQLKNFRLDNQ